MLRLTRWMADYYLCPWGQVLEAVVPAGVRHDAGDARRDVSRRRAGCCRANRATRSFRPSRRKCLQVLAASDRAADGQSNLPRRPAARSRRSTSCARKDSSSRRVERMSTERPRSETYAEQAAARTESRSSSSARRDSRCAARGRASHDSDSRRHRQRQDRSLHPGDRGSRPLRPAGDRAGAGDQPDAANASAGFARGSIAWPCCTAT